MSCLMMMMHHCFLRPVPPSGAALLLRFLFADPNMLATQVKYRIYLSKSCVLPIPQKLSIVLVDNALNPINTLRMPRSAARCGGHASLTRFEAPAASSAQCVF